MKLHRARCWVVFSAALAMAFAAPSARADVVAVGPAAFPGAPQITFTGVPIGTEVNGLLLGGVQFLFEFGPGQVAVQVGPANTNNIGLPSAVSGSLIGILTLTLPGPQNLFGFGFAVLNGTPGVNAVNVSVFNGATNVGSRFYQGFPDPSFIGGFAGIQSTEAFDRVQISFNPNAVSFAVDNIRFANVTTVTPEPATYALVLTGLAGIGFLRRRRRS